MRSLLFTLALLITSSQLHAQNNVIEITISDTLHVEGNFFHFRITVTPDYEMQIDTMGMRTDPNYAKNRMDRQKQRQIDYQQSIEKKLKENGFFTSPLSLAELAYRNNGQGIFMASTNSTKAIEYLLQVTNKERGVAFSLTNVSGKNEEEASKKLFQKVLTKARERANYIASLQKKKVTGILSVIDKRLENPYGYATASLLGGVIQKEKSQNEEFLLNKFTISNTVTVRFSVQ